jgi:sugar lactone lactonase YvrE
MTDHSRQLPAKLRRDLPGQDPGSPPRSAASEIRSTPVPASATTGLLTEGPRWHAERGELLWVDILGHTLHRGRPGPDGTLESVETITVDRPVGAVAPAIGGGYVLAAGTGFLYVDDAGTVEELAQPEAGRTDVRMNDGACDPQGRFWAGTIAYDEAPGAGVLYRLELDGGCTTVLTGLTVSNGIGWSPDGATGDLSQRRTLVRIQQAGVAPDGLTVDQDGGIGWRCGAAARSSAMEPTGRCWPRCACPSINQHRARSGELSLPRCSSPAPGPGSTKPRLTASPTPATCSGSTVSA